MTWWSRHYMGLNIVRPVWSLSTRSWSWQLVSWSSRLNSYSQFLDDAFNNFYNHLLGIRPNYITWKMPLQELSATKSPFPMKERNRPLCRILLHWMMGESIILQLWISPGTKKCHLLSPLRMLIHRHNSWSDWLICSPRSWKQKETNQRHRRIWWCCMGSMLVNHIRVRPPLARNRPLGEKQREFWDCGNMFHIASHSIWYGWLTTISQTSNEIFTNCIGSSK